MHRKAHHAKRDRPTTDGNSACPGGCEGSEGGVRRGGKQREAAEAEAERRKKDQDEAFAAWAREKDKIFRVRRREVRCVRVRMCTVWYTNSKRS